MKFHLCASIILGLISHCLAQNAQPVGTLFQVDLQVFTSGGCSYVTQPTMQSILQDSLDLLVVLNQLIANYRGGMLEARRLLDAFFVSQTQLTTNELTAIETIVNDLINWITNGGPVNARQSTMRPYLFCYHNWLQKKSMSSPAFNNQGQTFQNQNGRTVLIRDVPMYLARQQQMSTLLNKQAIPYWSTNHSEYIFDQNYGSSPNAGACSRQDFLGLTQHDTDPSTITFCPRAFGANTNRNTRPNLGTVNYVPLRSVPPNPVPSSTVPTGRANNNFQTLDALFPSAATFLHELFHLVLGNPASYPPGGEIYDLFPVGRNSPAAVGLSYALAVLNPESFVFVATAYDYTLHVAPNAAGQRVEFFSGYTTQG